MTNPEKQDTDTPSQEEPPKKKIAIIGDFVSDIIIPEESRAPLVFGKEMTVSGTTDPGALIGDGGIVYLQQIFETLLTTHYSDDAEHSFLEETWMHDFSNIREQSDLDLNHWSIAKAPQTLTKVIGPPFLSRIIC